jgi:hypothetical protein
MCLRLSVKQNRRRTHRTINTHSQRCVIYEYHPTRAGIIARDFFQDYQGYLHCDGYGGYEALFASKKVIHVALAGRMPGVNLQNSLRPAKIHPALPWSSSTC